MCGAVVTFDEAGNAINATIKNKVRMNEKGGKAVYVCTACNRLSARMYKLPTADPRLKGCIEQMDKDSKMKFFADHRDFLGKDLATALRTTIAKTSEVEDTEAFSGVGTWLDEVDLHA